MQLLTLAPLALAMLAFAGPACADEAYTGCMSTARTNMDFATCGQAMLGRRRRAQSAMENRLCELDAPTRAALLAEQRLWIAFKDKSCVYWSGGAYGRKARPAIASLAVNA
ncbi:lysozyme inhibitor LprI family protein [Sphingomonas sp. M1-B02]|uniref:lysozyme inhibitor LprI family protein n=1 Tax=Sphingomonas sp. M1-B02 TaxID=3114300 RepID=UPI00223F01FD|nr:lysozyme inhibitor LprI family protein [Sphingomonas sp. S6-11]UZK67504.1 hypothetical protein OKW87_06660 [Sphingomonas sp. S6-11]